MTRSPDAAWWEDAPKRRAPHALPTGPDLFDIAAPDPVHVAPDIRTPAPAAPGSTSSQNAADHVNDVMRRKSWRDIMSLLGGLPDGETLARFEIADALGALDSSICARIHELRGDDAHPWMVEKVDGARRSPRMPAIFVDGYRLTAAGRERVARAGGELVAARTQEGR